MDQPVYLTVENFVFGRDDPFTQAINELCIIVIGGQFADISKVALDSQSPLMAAAASLRYPGFIDLHGQLILSQQPSSDYRDTIVSDLSAAYYARQGRALANIRTQLMPLVPTHLLEAIGLGRHDFLIWVEQVTCQYQVIARGMHSRQVVDFWLTLAAEDIGMASSPTNIPSGGRL
jgi:dihydroorotase-like cyclic amidohydrolase